MLAVDTLPAIAREIGRDDARPTLGEAAGQVAAKTPLVGSDKPV